jgi:nucleotidyltransferase/DNA polymerase involved in DNA repair
MCIRLEQLGYRSVEDLARADPDALRAALGQISRILDVEGWIERARQNLAA